VGGSQSAPVVLTSEAEAAWREDGWCVLPAALPAEDLAGVGPALSNLFPGAAEMDAGEETERTAPWRTWDAQWPEFPFHSRTLNRLALHDVVLDAAEHLLGVDDIRMYLGLVSAKYASQPSGFNKLLHADYPNHTFVVPRAEPGFQQLELLVYLCDVTEDNGATRFLSLGRTAGIPVEEHTLNLADHGDLYSMDTPAIGPAGSIVAYRPDVYHRSVDWTEPGRVRFVLHVSFKPASMAWGGYQAWQIKGFSGEWHNFVRLATPRQLTVLGFPPPGDPYWTNQTLEGVSRRYGGMDMTPWT